MKTSENLKKRLDELETQRKTISKEIRNIKRILWQREHYQQKTNKNSLVWEMFNKPVRDLTPSERKKYDAIRQTKTREKKKSTQY